MSGHLGVEGPGDGQDKLVTVDVRPGSSTYGKVISTASVDGRNEAHHAGFRDDRRQLWCAGLDTSKVFIFDVHTDPAKPRLVKTIDNFAETTGGAVGPHGAYALPGRVLIPCLSMRKITVAALRWSNTATMATTSQPIGCRQRTMRAVQRVPSLPTVTAMTPAFNRAKTHFSPHLFAGLKSYMTEFGKVAADPEAMKHFGGTMVMWDFHARQPRKIFQVPGAPLEIRWAWGPNHNYAFTATALTSKLWLVYADDKGEWQAKEVAPISDVKGGVLPVDISLECRR